MLKLFNKKSENLFEPSNSARSIKKLKIVYPDFDISLQGDKFQNFTRLEDLYFHFAIDYECYLPQEIGDITSLRSLGILNLNYSVFPEWILKMENLESLIIRGNNIEYLPSEIDKMKNLKKLRIENCNIKTLPKSLNKLKKLKEISLKDNFYIKEIDPNCLPYNLKKLDIIVTNVTDKNKNIIKEVRPRLKLDRSVY
ncbi:leucine-rich repeat domain-containing protein [Flammeovirga aprica]|uniref:Leucine-rich repeat domain-containing protein n=1 Tax=Flammeovirga aprica JL-4 TaxID=694437 RepID=A0A7X9XDC7_9BACT|nr:leucine-rich repeat domain-containing protein [Flammeovirga aprica]NME72761.1 leucine-rich repeat domain-containing protein [Flammeovirga aprica JL-4]